MNRLVVAAALCACSCTFMIPRSTIMGQTAAPLSPGSAEVGLSAGLAWSHEGTQSSASGPSTDYLLIPNLDSNLSYGVSDWIDVNLHLGLTGLQPGAKINILRGDLALAVQPQLAIGYMHIKSNSNNSTADDDVIVAPGLRILVSHTSGFYAGLGYAFEYIYMGGSSSSSYQEHQLMLGVGYEAPAGVLRLRPEICLMLIPGRSASDNNGSESYDGVSFAMGASLTVALRTGGK